MQSASLLFAEAVRCASNVARQRGLTPPAFRSPPTDPGADRSIRRRGGQATVAVRLTGRSPVEVQADIIEGILSANSVPSDRRQPHRRAMWAALAASGLTG